MRIPEMPTGLTTVRWQILTLSQRDGFNMVTKCTDKAGCRGRQITANIPDHKVLPRGLVTG